MKKEIHVCLGCGRDTTARSQICRECAKGSQPPPMPWGVHIERRAPDHKPTTTSKDATP